MFRNESFWILESPIYYTIDGNLFGIYAYYPCKKGVKVEALIYNASASHTDLLAALIIGIEKISGRRFPLLFNHLLSMARWSID